ncbi:hypothetical protein [Denitromonas sp.]|uniref:hypothetical protein n=1 Tax=Denitromonas sp. TaxID=2734609 RepID=UPI001D9946BB|nr:hypothetical protein [Rhodocyclaceae bacterium]
MTRIAMHKSIFAGIQRLERERRANVIARPMRNMLDILARGEVDEIEGVAVMRMPEIDEQFAERAEWCEIAPAIEGWRDCWQRIAPDISTYHLGVLADRLRSDKPVTPRLVEQAREEFDATVKRIADTPDGKISRAITTTRIAWELEKLQGNEA